MDAVGVREQSERLREESRRLREVAAEESVRVIENVRAWGGPLGGKGEEFALRLPRLRASVGLVRDQLARWLERGEVPAGEALDIVLAASEACANAVEHPCSRQRAAFAVEAHRRAAEVEVIVCDFGRWRASAGGDATRGRGLAMMRRLMDGVAIEETGEGTRLRLTRRLHG